VGTVLLAKGTQRDEAATFIATDPSVTTGTALSAIDDGLVLRSQAGDPVAISELVRLARPILQRYARRFFPDPARAEDMAQTALMKAFARMGDLRSPEAFQTWLLRIARNECLNELTRQRVAQIPMSTLEDQGTALEAPAGGADDPEEQLVRAQMQALVRRVTATLPQHYRATLTMRALEDRSYEEISEALDIPVTVARLWYCRARKRFRTAFIQTLVARRDIAAECQDMGTAIAELIEGTLSRAKRDSVQEHLTGCAACRQTEDELRNTAFRAPARAMLFGLALARLPMSLRRSIANAGSRSQQLAGEIALGAAGSIVLVTGGLGGLHSATAQAAAPSPQQQVTLSVPALAGSVSAPAHLTAGARHLDERGDNNTVAVVAVGPAVATLPMADVAAPLPDTSIGGPVGGTPLTFGIPSHPVRTAVHTAGQLAATAVVVASVGTADLAARVAPVGLPLISQ
jgi:RNA polymerase sigma-70 factor, ECF subfamily